MTGTGKGSTTPEPEGPGPTFKEPGGWPLPRNGPALSRSSQAVWQLQVNKGTGPGIYWRFWDVSGTGKGRVTP